MCMTKRKFDTHLQRFDFQTKHLHKTKATINLDFNEKVSSKFPKCTLLTKPRLMPDVKTFSTYGYTFLNNFISLFLFAKYKIKNSKEHLCSYTE